MGSFDELQKNRTQISKMLKRVTNGEIDDFDFFVDYLSRGKPAVTLMLIVNSKVKRKYDFDMNQLIDNHTENIESVISSFGFPEIFKRSLIYQVL